MAKKITSRIPKSSEEKEEVFLSILSKHYCCLSLILIHTLLSSYHMETYCHQVYVFMVDLLDYLSWYVTFFAKGL